VLYFVVENWDDFRDKVIKKIKNLSLLEPVTGNSNSLLSPENSLLFVSSDSQARQAKRS